MRLDNVRTDIGGRTMDGGEADRVDPANIDLSAETPEPTATVSEQIDLAKPQPDRSAFIQADLTDRVVGSDLAAGTPKRLSNVAMNTLSLGERIIQAAPTTGSNRVFEASSQNGHADEHMGESADPISDGKNPGDSGGPPAGGNNRRAPSGKLLPTRVRIAVGNSVTLPSETFYAPDNTDAMTVMKNAVSGSHSAYVILASRDTGSESTDRSHFKIGTVVRVRGMSSRKIAVPYASGFAELTNKQGAKIEAVGLARIVGYEGEDEQTTATVEYIDTPPGDETKAQALLVEVHRRLIELANMGVDLDETLLQYAISAKTPDSVAFIAAETLADKHLISQSKLKLILAAETAETRIGLVFDAIAVVQNAAKTNLKIMEKRAEQAQRQELQEEAMALKRRLNDVYAQMGDAAENSEEAWEERIKGAKMSEEAEKLALKQLKRMTNLPPGSQEIGIIEKHLENLTDFPWSKSTIDNTDIAQAEKSMKEDHYELDEIAERIAQDLIVRIDNGTLNGKILCFVGPPGVGKSSIAKSIARAMGRKYVEISVAGVKDEAELLGHRITYVGAEPGRLIKAFQKAQSNNPLVLIDEINQMGMGRGNEGNPAAALLSIFDPQRNKYFQDLYMGVPTDVSKAFFIATANTLDGAHPALLDRMEIINFSSYVTSQKLGIAKRHLIPDLLKEMGLKSEQINISDDALRHIIDAYTYESGVRNLKRRLEEVFRNVKNWLYNQAHPDAKVNDKGLDHSGTLSTAEDVARYLKGPARDMTVEDFNTVGRATGLAWTEYGGEVLPVEVLKIPGERDYEVTGKLGEVMQESARVAVSYVKAHAEELGIAPGTFQQNRFHIHFPAGAIPKDGPSAGVTMVTALASEASGRAVKSGIAMTGEIGLKGEVLPIGGLREKATAAVRNGYHTIIYPARNQRDFDKIPEEIRSKLKPVPVSRIDQVLKTALKRQKRKKSEATVGHYL